MATSSVEIGALTAARTELISTLNRMLNDRDKEFLLDFKMGRPDWSYFSVPYIKELPAVKWKMYNLNQMAVDERYRMADALRAFFWM